MASAAGIAVKKKGRPAKESLVSEEDKLVALQYKLARKEAMITSKEWISLRKIMNLPKKSENVRISAAKPTDTAAYISGWSEMAFTRTRKPYSE